MGKPAVSTSRWIFVSTWLAYAAVASGCGRHDGAATADLLPLGTLSGQVSDTSGNQMPNVAVSLHGGSLATQTDAQGRFSLTPSSHQDIFALGFYAPGYAEQYRSVPRLRQSINFNVVLRPVDKSVTLTMPTDKSASARASVDRGDAGASITFPYEALIDPEGQLVRGDVQVDLTYWHPHGPLDSVPGVLAAIDDANVVTGLYTLGMLTIEATQDGKKLQLAEGKTAALFFQMPGNQRRQFESYDMPDIYWLDPSVALWRNQVSSASSLYTFDSANLTVSAQVSHLSTWNIDGESKPGYGGCISGSAINACTGGPAANQVLYLWGMTNEQLITRPLYTNAAGEFSLLLGGSRWTPEDAQGYSYLRYFISTNGTDARSGVASNTCNPLPPRCSTCNLGAREWNVPVCNSCAMQDDSGHNENYYVTDIYPDTCPFAEQSTVPIKVCSFPREMQATYPTCTMPQWGPVATYGKCGVVKTAVVQPFGCHCNPIGGTCGGGVTCCKDESPVASCGAEGKCVPCNASPGSPCDESSVCCAYNGIAFSCSDGSCVPSAVVPSTD